MLEAIDRAKPPRRGRTPHEGRALRPLRVGDLAEALAALTRSKAPSSSPAGNPRADAELRLARPSVLIDVSRLDALRQIGSAAPGGSAPGSPRRPRTRIAGGEMLQAVAAASLITLSQPRRRRRSCPCRPSGGWPLAGGARRLTQHRGPRPRDPGRAFHPGAYLTVLQAMSLSICRGAKLSRAGRHGF